MRLLNCLVLGFVVLGWCAAVAAADKPATTQPAANKPAASPHELAADAQHSRVSTIEDMKVRNAQGDDLGRIKDFVLDMKTGKVAYAALDFGGFLGIGDKLFAVPWNAFTLHENDKERYLVLNVTKEQLKDAPGFDKSHWPSMTDANWLHQVDRFYGERRTSSPEK